MTGRRPGSTEPRRRRRVGALGLVGLVLLAGALVVGAARPVPAEKAIGTAWEADRGLAFEAVRARTAGSHVRQPVEPAGTWWCEDGLPDSFRGCVQRVGTLWCGHDLNDAGGAARLRNLGDFNGDGKDDVLLRHQDGSWHYYAMDGRNVLAHYRTSRLSWGLTREVAGVGDFDGDGRDDLLLRSEIDGSWHYYRMNGWRVLRGSGRARLTRDLAWQVAGIADLNGDGKDDVLLRKTDGRWYFYPMDGRTVLPGRGTVRMTWDLAWRLVGFGHFDGDVRKSVLLRHPDGRWWYYRIQGRQVELGPLAVDLPDDTSETVAGVGDLNGDGHTDVLVRHADGGWHYHALYGGRVASFGTGLPGARALSEDLAWGALSCSNRGSTALPGRTLIDSQDKTVLLSTAFGHDQTLTYQVRSSEPDVLRASVTADVLTLMPVTEGRSTVTVTGRDPDGNSATQAFAVRYALNTFQDCAECPTMVIVPAGTFTMGAPESEIDSGYPGGIGSEQPQRTVSIPAFAARSPRFV